MDVKYLELTNKAKFKLDHANETVAEESARLEQAKLALAHHQKALQIVQTVAQAVQQAVHSKIAKVVSNCLETIFDDPYSFEIKFEMRRGRTEADLFFVRNGMEVDPMTAAGGGVVDVATFALRVACLSLQKELDPVLILDEPFKFLSRDLQPRLRALLQNVSKELGIQFIIVTHFDTLQIGKIIKL